MVVVLPAPLGPSRPKHSPAEFPDSSRAPLRPCRRRSCADRGIRWRQALRHFSGKRLMAASVVLMAVTYEVCLLLRLFPIYRSFTRPQTKECTKG